jgi:hypothetical protein
MQRFNNDRAIRRSSMNQFGYDVPGITTCPKWNASGIAENS